MYLWNHNLWHKSWFLSFWLVFYAYVEGKEAKLFWEGRAEWEFGEEAVEKEPHVYPITFSIKQSPGKGTAQSSANLVIECKWKSTVFKHEKIRLSSYSSE